MNDGQRYLLAVDASSLRTEVAVVEFGASGVQLLARRSSSRAMMSEIVDEHLLYETMRDAKLAFRDLAGWALGRPPPARPQEACDVLAELLGGLALCYDRRFFEFSSMAALAAEMAKVAEQQTDPSAAHSAINLRAASARVQRSVVIEVAFGCSGTLMLQQFEIHEGRAIAAARRGRRQATPDLRVLCGVEHRRRPSGLRKSPTIVVPGPRATDLAQMLDLHLHGHGRKQSVPGRVRW